VFFNAHRQSILRYRTFDVVKRTLWFCPVDQSKFYYRVLRVLGLLMEFVKRVLAGRAIAASRRKSELMCVLPHT
jgi:hypothetical protein